MSFLVAASVSGCATTQSPAPEPSLSAVPTPTSLADYPLPLDQFRPGDEENVLIRKAYGLLIRDCMRRIGFPGYSPPTVVSQPRPDGPDEFGYLNESAAATIGFHDSRALAGKKPSGSPGVDTPAEIAALSGTPAPGGSAAPPSSAPSGGCAGEADRVFRKDLKPIDSALLTRLATQAHDSTLADSRVVAATRQWSVCMWQAGYAYLTPADPTTEQWAPQPTPTELAIARADVACTRQSNLPGIAMAVMAQVERRQVEQNRSALDAVRSVVDDWLRKARHILAGGAA